MSKRKLQHVAIVYDELGSANLNSASFAEFLRKLPQFPNRGCAGLAGKEQSSDDVRVVGNLDEALKLLQDSGTLTLFLPPDSKMADAVAKEYPDIDVVVLAYHANIPRDRVTFVDIGSPECIPAILRASM